MADGYARATGGLGACFGIGGPGVLNMVTALAQRDSQGSTQASSRRSPPTSLPAGRSDDARAVLEAVDAVVDTRSIPEDVQRRVVAAPGESGAVEIVALCGLYAIMGYMVTAFDIPIEEGFPSPPR
jgi:glyoxylate carboligase